jgi:hypothetical protein
VGVSLHFGVDRGVTDVPQFVELSDQDRKAAKPLGKLGKGDQVEVRVRPSPSKNKS